MAYLVALSAYRGYGQGAQEPLTTRRRISDYLNRPDIQNHTHLQETMSNQDQNKPAPQTNELDAARLLKQLKQQYEDDVTKRQETRNDGR